MKLGKRQLVLATLVVALGAAVYLSWMLSDDQCVKITETLSSRSEYGEAEFVSDEIEEDVQETMAEVSSLTETSSQQEEEVQQDSEVVQTMAQARLTRQQARDTASEFLDELLEKENGDQLQEAADKAAQLADNIIRESNIETLVKAKGYSDCITILENDQCSVVVRIDMAQPNDAVIIKDIVHTQTGLPYDAIKIVEIQ